MKRRVHSIALTFVLLFLCGCAQNYDAKQSTIFVGRNGTIIETSVEKMDQSYYNDSELESFIAEEIAEFESSEGTVEETDYEMDEQTATLTLTYSNWKTYEEFNRRIFYEGTVVKAQAAGFDFDVPFTSAEDGSSVEKEKVLEVPEQRIVILETSQAVEVRVPGRLLYISDHVKAEGKSLASVEKSRNESLTELAYIIYK